ncbi:glycerophosphodiester phosphodiesterase family protein [uncultured Alsobacter sp.]|uniref:glycerophosphodiester phosphodiesterase n=1 Tax=uncultured Alsobacter sp. TaxID=1748258 RepID=UPI0025D282CA|nr:glycerophosphodiester phosphodiesterase family protein [uncultured Alsobacter sp.]
MPYDPLNAGPGRIHICGHRGHSIGAPENTVPAIVEAARRGATVCEIDIVLTADDALVLLHDEVVDRTTNGKGRAAALTLAEVRALDAGAWFSPAFAGTRVPTLGEALDAAKGAGVGLLVEIKERQRPDRLIDRLAGVLADHEALEEVLVISFDHPSLVAAQRRIPGLRTELITHARHVDPVEMARRAGAASVAIEADMFHPDDARALRAAGVATRVTVPRPERIALRRAAGLDPLARVNEGLAADVIDVLAGDDVTAVVALAQAKGKG